MKVIAIAVLGTLMAFSASAQERTSGGNVETQMTWSALSTLVKDANARTVTINARMDQNIKCNAKFKLYAPGVGGADNDGCIPNKLIDLVNDRVDQLKLDLEETNAKLAALDARVTSEVKRLDGGINKVAADLKALSEHVDAADKELKARIDAVNTRVSGVVLDIQDLDKRVDATEKDIAVINDTIVRINENITGIRGQIRDLTLRVSDNTDDISKIIGCAKLGKTYNGTGCVGGKVPTVEKTGNAVTFAMSTQSDKTASSGNYSIPAGTSVIVANVAASVRGSEAIIDSSIIFNNAGGFPVNKLAYLAGVSSGNTAHYRDTKYIPVPTGATSYKITYTASSVDNVTKLEATLTTMGPQ